MLIAVAPGYATIGVAAPRFSCWPGMLQGLSVGGECGASATYLSEMAPVPRGDSGQVFNLCHADRRAIGGAFVTVLLLQLLLSDEATDSWGWRVPFVISAILALVVYILRSRLAETGSFKSQPQIVPFPMHAIFGAIIRASSSPGGDDHGRWKHGASVPTQPTCRSFSSTRAASTSRRRQR
ncbi:MAG: MFS transporter [Sphingomonadales bacterium]|nr:MFS transporter [Sphingomonadales bacterium]